MVSATVKRIVDNEESLWETVQFNGPFPFGYPPCITVYAPSGRVLIPRIVETIVQRHGSRVRTMTCRDLLANDAMAVSVANNCAFLTALDLSHADHRLIPNVPAIPSVITSAGLSALRICVNLRELQLRYCQVGCLPVARSTYRVRFLTGAGTLLASVHVIR